ncbi:MAG TPA: hypothetical protein VEW45_07370 [Candidatus Dormibacteraeota bacterium]|nr:hypothetical protein [Candidatus Dormibacteraeota bacterium]
MANKKPKKHDERAAHGNRQDAPEVWPGGMPYTVYFPDGKDYRGADLEHPAPLPRIGDRVDYIDERGVTKQFRVRDVVHTLQTSAAARPSVREGPATPNALARTDDAPAEALGGAGTLRSGLPEVFLAPMEPDARAAAKPKPKPQKRSRPATPP